MTHDDKALERIQTLIAERDVLRQAIGFFASVIKSGEPWTETCEETYRAVLDGPPAESTMAQVDIYLDGFRSQKCGIGEWDNPFPEAQQPACSLWYSGWHRGKLYQGGLEGVAPVRAEFIALHGAE